MIRLSRCWRWRQRGPHEKRSTQPSTSDQPSSFESPPQPQPFARPSSRGRKYAANLINNMIRLSRCLRRRRREKRSTQPSNVQSSNQPDQPSSSQSPPQPHLFANRHSSTRGRKYPVVNKQTTSSPDEFTSALSHWMANLPRWMSPPTKCLAILLAYQFFLAIIGVHTIFYQKVFRFNVITVGTLILFERLCWLTKNVTSDLEPVNAKTRNYIDRVMDSMKDIITCHLSEHHPRLLLHKNEVKKRNEGKTSRKTVEGKWVPNPAWVTVTLKDELCDEIVRATVDIAWENQETREAILGIQLNTSDITKGCTAINSKEDLVSSMLCTDSGGVRVNNGNIFKRYLSTTIRKSLETAYDKAKKNELENHGPFRGIDGVRPNDEIEKEKNLIMSLVSGRAVRMSKLQATAALIEICTQFGKEHLVYLEVQQMSHLMVEYVMSDNDLRKVEIDAEIEELRKAALRKGAVRRELHPQELNEIAVHIDCIIKIKANINRAIELLMEGRAIVLNLYDDEFNDYIMDIYVLAPANLNYEICQGQAKKLIGSYKAYKGHRKKLPKNGYMVGLFSARVFTLFAHEAIRSYNGVVVGYGALLPNGNIIREIAYTSDTHSGNGDRKFQLSNPEGGKPHIFTLHRFVLIVASCHGFSIFEVGALQKLDINLPEGHALDEYIGYHPPKRSSSAEAIKIMRKLRVESAHSQQCDGEHRMGRCYRFLDSNLFCALISHRMNICFIFMRKNAGHWCCGCEIMPYNGGLDVDTGGSVVDFNSMEQMPKLKVLNFPSADEIREGTADTTALAALPRLDPLTVLQRVEKPWLSISKEVDCSCNLLREINGERCEVCKLNLMDMKEVVKDEVEDFEDDEDEENVGVGTKKRGGMGRIKDALSPSKKGRN